MKLQRVRVSGFRNLEPTTLDVDAPLVVFAATMRTRRMFASSTPVSIAASDVELDPSTGVPLPPSPPAGGSVGVGRSFDVVASSEHATNATQATRRTNRPTPVDVDFTVRSLS